MPYSQSSPGARAPGPREAGEQIVQVGLGDVDGEGADAALGVRGHGYRRIGIGTLRSYLRRRICWRPRRGCWPCSRCCSPARPGPVPNWPSGSRSPTARFATTSTGSASWLPGRRDPRPAGPLPARRRREAAAAAARRRGGRRGRGRTACGRRRRRDRGEQCPGADEARAGPAPSAPAPGERDPRCRRDRTTPARTSRIPRSTRTLTAIAARRIHDELRFDYRGARSSSSRTAW